jgi:hypothetical protein
MKTSPFEQHRTQQQRREQDHSRISNFQWQRATQPVPNPRKFLSQWKSCGWSGTPANKLTWTSSDKLPRIWDSDMLWSFYTQCPHKCSDIQTTAILPVLQIPIPCLSRIAILEERNSSSWLQTVVFLRNGARLRRRVNSAGSGRSAATTQNALQE